MFKLKSEWPKIGKGLHSTKAGVGRAANRPYKPDKVSMLRSTMILCLGERISNLPMALRKCETRRSILCRKVESGWRRTVNVDRRQNLVFDILGLAPVWRDANPYVRTPIHDPTLAEFVVMMALMRLWRIVGRPRSFGVGCNSEMSYFALIVENEYGTLIFHGAGRGGGIIGD